MNFIVRNLGWILLIIFFIFMLYLISNQNNVKKMELNSSGSIVNTGGINENDISKLKNIDKNIVIKEYNNSKITDTKNISNKKEISKTNDKKGEDTSLLKKVTNYFSGDDSNKKDNKIVKTDENNNVANNNVAIINGEKNKKDLLKENSKLKNNKNSDKKNILKNKTETLVKEKTNSEKKSKNNNSKKISEKIKNRNKTLHTVGVKSVALNNPYFTKKVGYAYKGDKLEQLTNTNRYGCFNSEVTESKKSMGKKGWTCIYYMEGHLNEISKYQKQSIDYYRKLRKRNIAKKIVQNKIKVSNKSKKYPLVEKRADGTIIITKDPHRVYEGPTYNTEVGSLYLVRVNSLKLNNENFSTKKGYLESCTSKNCDVLEQLTPVNENGCFKINVFMSKTNKNKRGWVCQKYLR